MRIRASETNPFRRPVVVTAGTIDRWYRTVEILGKWGHLDGAAGSHGFALGGGSGLEDGISAAFGVHVHCAPGVDLDEPFSEKVAAAEPKSSFSYIFAFNVLEHLFNPLHALLEASRLLPIVGHGGDARPRIFASVPRRSCILRYRGHFHEFDDYRWSALIARAGLEIVSEARFRVGHDLAFGIRPLTRYVTDRVCLYALRRA